MKTSGFFLRIRNSRIAYAIENETTGCHGRARFVSGSRLAPQLCGAGGAFGHECFGGACGGAPVGGGAAVGRRSRRIRRKPFLEFLLHGVPYVFAASPGEVTRGMPTAWAAPVLAAQLTQSEGMSPVWPSPAGNVQGIAVKPLYRSVIKAVQRNPELYDLLALVDALRMGRARERRMAEGELKHRLGHDA